MTSIVVVLLLFTVTGTLAFQFSGWPFQSRDQQPTPLWSDLRVHWSPRGEAGGFFPLPRTAVEASKLGYTTPAEEVAADPETLCPDRDPTVCILLGKDGNIAGIDIGVRRSDVDDKGYPFDRHPMFVPKARYGNDMYITRLFFTDVEKHKLPFFDKRKTKNADATGTGLWLQMGKTRDQLFEIPRLEKDIAKTAYTKQNCVPGMGDHYYYNISTSMDCEDFEPIFALFKNSEMIGFGFQVNGRATPFSKVWFESVPAAAIRPTIPTAPQCLVDNTKQFGVISLHVYFVDQPWAINCTDTS